MNAPAFPLSLTGQNQTSEPNVTSFGLQSSCDGKITLKPDGSGVTTGLQFENNQINAPLAFSGSTSVLGQCINFTGWAQAVLNLRYDEATQNVTGEIEVQTVNLDGITPLASGFVTPIVQGTIRDKVNPIQILRGEQIALNVPIAATNGNLQARVKDVRSEIKDNALNLYVTYDFKGLKQ
jgi:hypothetical protein